MTWDEAFEGMESEDIDQIKKDLKNYKNGQTSFELLAPSCDIRLNKSNLLFEYETPSGSYYIYRHKYEKRISKILFDLRTNFERELGDLRNNVEMPDEVIFFSKCLCKEQLKPTSDYRYIGYVEIYDKVITICWLHPFFRDKGLFSRFLIDYGSNVGALVIAPPFTKQMKGCIRKVEAFSKGNIALHKNNQEHSREYFANLAQTSEDKILIKNMPLNYLSMLKMMYEIANNQKRKDKPKFDLILGSVKEIMDNKELQEELIQYAKKRSFTEDDWKKLDKLRGL